MNTGTYQLNQAAQSMIKGKTHHPSNHGEGLPCNEKRCTRNATPMLKVVHIAMNCCVLFLIFTHRCSRSMAITTTSRSINVRSPNKRLSTRSSGTDIHEVSFRRYKTPHRRYKRLSLQSQLGILCSRSIDVSNQRRARSCARTPRRSTLQLMCPRSARSNRRSTGRQKLQLQLMFACSLAAASFPLLRWADQYNLSQNAVDPTYTFGSVSRGLIRWKKPVRSQNIRERLVSHNRVGRSQTA